MCVCLTAIQMQPCNIQLITAVQVCGSLLSLWTVLVGLVYQALYHVTDVMYPVLIYGYVVLIGGGLPALLAWLALRNHSPHSHAGSYAQLEEGEAGGQQEVVIASNSWGYIRAVLGDRRGVRVRIDLPEGQTKIHPSSWKLIFERFGNLEECSARPASKDDLKAISAGLGANTTATEVKMINSEPACVDTIAASSCFLTLMLGLSMSVCGVVVPRMIG